jgi:hypothetical protein
MKLQGEMQVMQAEGQQKQQEFKMKMAAEQQRFQAKKQEYEMELQAKMQEMRLEQAAFIEQMKRDQQESQVKIMNIVAQGAAKAQAARMQPRKSNGA